MNMDNVPQRPKISPDEPIHFAKNTYKGGGLCEDIRDKDFGCLWNNDEFALSHITQTGFKFTMKPSYVSCEKCKKLLKDFKEILDALLVGL